MKKLAVFAMIIAAFGLLSMPAMAREVRDGLSGSTESQWFMEGFVRHQERVDLPLTSFCIWNSRSAPVVITVSTAPRLEHANASGIPILQWPNLTGTTATSPYYGTPAQISFRVPNNYHASGRVVGWFNQSDVASSVAIDFEFVVNTFGQADTGDWVGTTQKALRQTAQSHTARDLVGKARDTTADVLGLYSTIEQMAFIPLNSEPFSANDLIVFRVWKTDVDPGGGPTSNASFPPYDGGGSANRTASEATAALNAYGFQFIYEAKKL